MLLACACGGIAEIWIIGTVVTFCASCLGYRLVKGSYFTFEKMDK